MDDASRTVDAFLAAVCEPDLDQATAMLTEDVVYDNVPMGAVHGRSAVRDTLGPMLASATEIEWVVHRQVSDGRTVLNERLDRFLISGRWLEIPVAGVFEVSDGHISLWRDYFDLRTFEQQVAPPKGVR